MATRRLPEVAITAKLSLLIYFSACLIGSYWKINWFSQIKFFFYFYSVINWIEYKIGDLDLNFILIPVGSSGVEKFFAYSFREIIESVQQRTNS